MGTGRSAVGRAEPRMVPFILKQEAQGKGNPGLTEAGDEARQPRDCQAGCPRTAPSPRDYPPSASTAWSSVDASPSRCKSCWYDRTTAISPCQQSRALGDSRFRQASIPHNSAMFTSTACRHASAARRSTSDISWYLQSYPHRLELFPQAPTATRAEHRLQASRPRHSRIARRRVRKPNSTSLLQKQEPIPSAARVNLHAAERALQHPRRVRNQHVAHFTTPRARRSG